MSIRQSTSKSMRSEGNSKAPADGFYRLWSDNEAYFVTVTGDRVQFRGRDFTASVSECLANGDRFEPVTALKVGPPVTNVGPVNGAKRAARAAAKGVRKKGRL